MTQASRGENIRGIVGDGCDKPSRAAAEDVPEAEVAMREIGRTMRSHLKTQLEMTPTHLGGKAASLQSYVNKRICSTVQLLFLHVLESLGFSSPDKRNDACRLVRAWC